MQHCVRGLQCNPACRKPWATLSFVKRSMRPQNLPPMPQDLVPEDQREIRVILDEIEKEAVPQRLLDLAEQLQAALVARRKGSLDS